MSEPESTAEFLGMGIDLSTDTFTDEEKARTLAWYREYHDHGELDLLPAQLIPLLTLHLSAVRLWPKPLRRSLQTARALRVRRGQDGTISGAGLRAARHRGCTAGGGRRRRW